jgi:hypothetical protein
VGIPRLQRAFLWSKVSLFVTYEAEVGETFSEAKFLEALGISWPAWMGGDVQKLRRKPMMLVHMAKLVTDDYSNLLKYYKLRQLFRQVSKNLSQMRAMVGDDLFRDWDWQMVWDTLSPKWKRIFGRNLVAKGRTLAAADNWFVEPFVNSNGIDGILVIELLLERLFSVRGIKEILTKTFITEGVDLDKFEMAALKVGGMEWTRYKSRGLGQNRGFGNIDKCIDFVVDNIGRMKEGLTTKFALSPVLFCTLNYDFNGNCI